MNYLAHAYLSFQHDEILVGNMSSDFIKGKKRYDYPPQVQTGIELHRRIDAFTDTHIITAEAKKYFKDAVGTYSGAFTDVAFDYFLANDQNEFTETSLKEFSQYTYSTLEKNFEGLPQKLQLMLPYMKQQDWLFNYRSFWGIEKSFEGIVKRAVYLKESKPAYNVFIEYCDTLRPLYQKFFPELKAFAFSQLQTLTTQSL
jgi:acyl carrier protein phosphodiesterase